MTRYRIVIMKPAKKFIERQTRRNQERLLTAIYRLPYEGDIKRLSGRDNVYRLRTGDFRVIYSVLDDIVTVAVSKAGNRGDVYKKN